MSRPSLSGSVFARFPGFFTLSLAITLIGVGNSITRPYMSLFYSNVIHMSPLRLGLFAFINGLGGIIASTWLGKKSDSGTPKKDVILFATVTGGLGFISFLFLHSYLVLLIVSTVLLGAGAAAYPQLFAYAREAAVASSSGDATLALSTLRSFFSLAWVLGPLFGALVMGWFSYQGLFTSTAAVFAIVLVLVAWRLVRRPISGQIPRGGPQLWPTLKRPDVLTSCISFVAVSTATSMNFTYMPLFVTRTLHGPQHMVGWVFSFSAGLEIPVMIGLANAAVRLGKRPLLLAGSISGTLYYLGAALAKAPWQMLALQLLCAVFVAITVSIGMSYMQDFMPDSPGVATTLYSNTNNLGSMAGSLLGGVIAESFGFRSVYWVCVGLAVMSYVFLLRRKKLRSTPALPASGRSGAAESPPVPTSNPV